MLHVRRNAGGAVNIIVVVVFITVLMSVDCFRVDGLSWGGLLELMNQSRCKAFGNGRKLWFFEG